MSSLIISPSNLAVIAVVRGLIFGARAVLNEITFDDNRIPLHLLCFLGDITSRPCLPEYKDISDLRRQIVNYLVESVEESTADRIVDDLLCRLIRCGTIESLIDFAEDIRQLFEVGQDVSPNNLFAPTKLCLDSNLGIMTRSFLARWECMSFEAVCSLLESLRRFLSTGPTAKNFTQCILKPKIGGIEYAAMQGDMRKAEELVHNHFDNAGGDPLFSLPLKSQEVLSPAQALEAFSNPDLANSFGNRHQQAMLELASVFVRCGHYDLALTSVEEAMKTAHQRGDDSSVAKALLLLHHVIVGFEGTCVTNEENVGLDRSTTAVHVSAEETLVRCLDRCESSNLTALAAQAVILLVRLRSTQQLTWSGPTSHWLAVADEVDDIGTHPSSGDSIKGNHAQSVQCTWALLLSSLVEDTRLSTQLARGAVDVHPAITPQAKDVRGPASGLLTLSDEFAALSSQAAVVAADFWMRLGVPAMSLLQCSRALRQLGLVGSYPELVGLCCRAAKRIVDNSFGNGLVDYAESIRRSHQTVGGADDNRQKWAIAHALRILGLAAQLYAPSGTVPAVDVTNMIEQARLYVAVHGALVSFNSDSRATSDIKKALRLGQRLVEACEPMENVVAVAGNINSRKTQLRTLGRTSVAKSEAQLLLARVTALVDIDKALLLLDELERSSARQGTLYLAAEAAVLRVCILHRQSANIGALRIATPAPCTCKEIDVHRTLSAALSIARSYHFPFVEAAVCAAGVGICGVETRSSSVFT